MAGGRLGSLARLGFDEAFDRYLAERQIEIQNPRHEADCAKPLRTFFRGKRLNQVAADDIKAYQSARVLQGRKPKTVNLEAGTRAIPLNDEAWSAIAAMKQHADALGTYAPENYVFHRVWPWIDGTQSMGRSGWRSAWRSLRKAAAKEDKEKGYSEMPRLASLRFYDLRHQFVTELCEAGIPESVIRELAGHVDPAMIRIYRHPRLAARRAAVEALATVKTGQFERGYGTNHVTKALPASTIEVRVVEKNSRGERI